MQRGCGDRGMAHRDADLVQRVHNVAGRIDALVARALLLVDRDTATVAHAKAKRLRQRIPGSRLIIYSQSGHCPMVDQAERWNHDLEGFLDGRLVGR